MTPDEFRKRGHEVIDWIANYMETVEDSPVLSQVKPGEVFDALPASPPTDGESIDAMMRDLDDIIMPGITHWQSPNFFAYFPANASGPAILGDLISSGLGVQGMIWATSPACTELETRVLDWLASMCGLPSAFLSSSTGGGAIQDSASSAALCALIAARERVSDLTINRNGIDRTLVVYASTQTHSSIEKSVRISGIGSANLRLIPVDSKFAMKADELALAIDEDLASGRIPCLVCATVGTTSSNAIDPVSEIGEICHDRNLWLHVDAAMSGTAAIVPEFRHIIEGLEFADSYCFNPHKWMFTNFDCDCFWVRDRSALINALSILPEYLRNQATESGAVIDYRDWQIPLGRRFRALKLWFVIRHYGVEGLQHHIRRHVEISRTFAAWIEADDNFELAVDPPLNLVCFRHRGGDMINQKIMDRLNQSGKIFFTHTKLDGKLTLRLSIGGTWTDLKHVERAWRLIRRESIV